MGLIVGYNKHISENKKEGVFTTHFPVLKRLYVVLNISTFVKDGFISTNQIVLLEKKIIMKLNLKSFFEKAFLLIITGTVLLSCNDEGEKKTEESITSKYDINKINLRRKPLPYPPLADTVFKIDSLILQSTIDSLFMVRDSLQSHLMLVSTEGINSELKDKKIKTLEKLFDLNTDIIVNLQMKESLCHTNDDSQPVELYAGNLGVSKAFVEKISRSVGQLQWKYNFGSGFNNPNDNEGNVKGVRWCTGTLIGKDTFITAGHCFDREGNGWKMPSRNGQTISSNEIAQLMKVNFNYQIDKITGKLRSDTIDYPVIELKENQNGDFDYAIIILGKDKDGNYPGEKFGIVEIAKSVPSLNDMTAIIQHPLGNPKVIEAGGIYSIKFNLLNYDDIDTRGGSSGAAVISFSENKIIGIHVLGGCDNVRDGSNHATPIYLIKPYSPIITKLSK